ncbi:MAG: hypothetical protein LBH41_01325 [Rickettsiales bacterium]|jgi:KDO2-lipid IV(A) lauroyltransferase|nr:hypothetical protein [Rickettsiales bacterium]
MLEKLWSALSFDMLPTLPVEASFWRAAALAAFSFFPAYIAYAKQSSRRRFIYRTCAVALVLFFIVIFVRVERFYFDRGTITVFAKSLWALMLAGAVLDARDPKARMISSQRPGFYKEFIKHPAESFFAHIMFFIFKLLPVRAASGLGAAIGRSAGFFHRRYSRLADENIKLAFPKKTLDERKNIARGMWSMLGRYCAEPEHFDEFYRNFGKYITCKNDAILDKLKGRPFVAFISHSGTMGLVSIPFAKHSTPCSIIYKYPSNNLTDRLVTRSFGRGIGKLSFIPNNARGTKAAMGVLRSGGAILVVPDQKFQTGIEGRFFGRRVKSPVGAAKLASHFDCPILPIQIAREKGLSHRIIFHEPFMPARDSSGRPDEAETMQQINNRIEQWVRENPSQWFWVHDRFDIKDGIK